MASNTRKNTSLFGNVPKVNTDTNAQSDANVQPGANETVQPAGGESKDTVNSSLADQIQNSLAGKKAGKEKISGYVPVELAAQFKATCKANKNKQSDVIEQLLRLYVSSANK